MGKIIKGKYFHWGTLLKANLGSRPSFAWRSILAARDRWIPKPITYSVQTPCRVLSEEEEATVNELFDPNKGGWNRDLLREIFVEEEVEIIGNLPISKCGRPDKLIWRASPSGTFNVKSAYHMEMEMKMTKSGTSSDQSGCTQLWKSLWGLQIPNSSKVFLWRACKHILPTKDNLFKRGVVQDDICHMCGNECEMVMHIIWECPSAVDIWGACRGKLQKSSCHGNCFLDVFEHLLSRCSYDEVCFFAILSKKIWGRRNSMLLGGDMLHPNLLIQEGEALLLQFKELEDQKGSAPTDASAGKAKWSPPQVGKLKVNWDVSFDNKNQRMGVGVIVRDPCGLVCAAKSEVIQMLHQPGAGEAWGALRAAEFCVEMGFFDIIILEGDSLTIVKAIGDAEASMRPFGQIVEV